MIVLLVLVYFFFKQQGKLDTEGRMFLALCATNFALLALELAIDVLGIVYPRAFLAPVVTGISLLFYVLNPVPGIFYFLYIQQVIGKRCSRKFILLLLLPWLANAVLSIASPLTGWLFQVNEQSVYSRGPYFALLVVFNYSYLLAGPLYLITHHSQLQRKIFNTLLVFPFPVAIAGVLQIAFFGVEILWVSLTISLLILFFNVEASQVNRDYLTGLFNRRYFQKMATLAFAKKRVVNPQWAVLLDIDGFKYINDTYGHAKGDEALIVVAHILEQIAPPQTVVSRYGGDEFALLTVELPKLEILTMYERLEQKLSESNASHQFPDTLTISAGCAPLVLKEHADLDAFLHHLDMSMYKAKMESKKTNTQSRSAVFHLCE